MVALQKIIKEFGKEVAECKFRLKESYDQCREQAIENMTAPWGLYPYGTVARAMNDYEEQKGIEHAPLRDEFIEKMTRRR